MTSLSGASTSALSVANPWALVPPLGNLDAYISAVNRLPMLTLEQEQEFARKMRNDNDVEAAGKLVLSHLRLVVSVARQYLGYGLPHGDLIQEGNVGLMKAVRRFDPDHGVRLVSYALHWIKAEIHEYILKNWRMVKVATTKSQRKLFFNLRSMKQGFKAEAAAGNEATHRDTLNEAEIESMARDLKVKREDVIEMETRLSGGDVMLDRHVYRRTVLDGLGADYPWNGGSLFMAVTDDVGPLVLYITAGTGLTNRHDWAAGAYVAGDVVHFTDDLWYWTNAPTANVPPAGPWASIAPMEFYVHVRVRRIAKIPLTPAGYQAVGDAQP